MFRYTGAEGNKKFSIKYNPIKKTWKPTKREGKKICIIPSDRCFIKVEKANSKFSEIYKKYSQEIEKKFTGLPFDISVFNERVYIAVYKEPEELEECYSIELEPFALARVFALFSKEGFAVHINKTKTTFVKIEEGLFVSFRVVMKGYSFLKNCQNLKDGLKEIINQSGYEIGESAVLVTGEGAYLEEIKEIFPNLVENKLFQPELALAFGGSLKFVGNNPYPNFLRKKITKEELRKTGIYAAAMLLIFLFSIFTMERVFSVNELKEAQKREFKKLFPNTPTISLQEQIKAKFSDKQYPVTKKLEILGETLKSGMVITSIEYIDGVLNVKGEADEKVLSEVKTKSRKKTPKGTIEFEVEI